MNYAPRYVDDKHGEGKAVVLDRTDFARAVGALHRKFRARLLQKTTLAPTDSELFYAT